MPKELACKDGLKKNVIKKDVFDREMGLCKSLSRQNSGQCAWGKCKSCGVVPLLYKLHKGQLIEDKKEVKKVKEFVL